MDIDKAFRVTCKILFGTEIGSMEEYHDYFQEAVIGQKVCSSFSKKELHVASPRYCKDAKFFDYNEENTHLKKANTEAINNIKDMDSLISAVRENLVYSGNKILGDSNEVKDSDCVTDSSFVYNSSIVIKCKYIAYSFLKRNTEYAFACTSTGNSSHVLRCFNATYLRRCFECSDAANSSDCYFCYNAIGCTNCMFSFNIRNRKNTICNVQLTEEQYRQMKARLVSEMVEELKAKKRLHYSVVDFGE